MDTLDLDCHNKQHGYDHIDQTDCYYEPGENLWNDCDSFPCPNRLFSITAPQQLSSENFPRFHPTTLDQIRGLIPESIPLPSTRAPTPAPPTDPVSPIRAPSPEALPTPPAPTMSQETINALIAGQTQMQQALTALTQAVTTLTTTVNNRQQGTPERTLDKALQKPMPFKGNSSADARRFLAAFSTYAMTTGSLLNNATADGAYAPDDRKWIVSALTFLQDEAAIWATPYLETVAEAEVAKRPFQDSWATFKADFRSRFETSNEAVDAKDALRALWQGSKTVPEYAAKFKELMSRTGYSAADLRDRFYEHLASSIKDELVHTARPIGTLDELLTVATELDVRIRQRRAEKAREQGKSVPSPRLPPTTTSAAPFAAKDPNAMDIDGTHSREAFIKSMTGKCFGCGSTAHSKRDGNHERDICAWCGRTGHREVVCQSKFMGQPKKQRVAATEEAPSDTAAAAEATVSASQVDVIAQLLEGQRQLAAQIEAMKQAF